MPTRVKVLSIATVVVSGFVFTGMASTATENEPSPSGATLSWKHLPDRTGVRLSPHTDLKNLRFVYAVNGKLHVEIEGDTERTEKLLTAFFGKLENVGFGQLLTAEQEDEVCRSLSIPDAAQYILLLPSMEVATLSKRVGISCYYEGGGGRVP